MNTQEKEVTKIIQGEKNVFEAVSRFISAADTRIDACVDQSRPALARYRANQIISSEFS